MSNIETITSANVSRLEALIEPLVNTYKIAFAGPPWFEASKCINKDCTRDFCSENPDEICPECASVLTEAYDNQELEEFWRSMIEQDEALMEIELEDAIPLRATLVRPTTPAELFARKYPNNPPMEEWLKMQLPPTLVWIEDTFANRDRRAKGNLKKRGATLARIASAYSGLKICTRTIAPQIIAATLRDIKDTKVFIGTESTRPIANIVSERRPEIEYLSVPDRRTVLAVNALRGKT